MPALGQHSCWDALWQHQPAGFRHQPVTFKSDSISLGDNHFLWLIFLSLWILASRTRCDCVSCVGRLSLAPCFHRPSENSSVNRFQLSMMDLVPNVMQGIVTWRDVIVCLFSDFVWLTVQSEPTRATSAWYHMRKETQCEGVWQIGGQ